MLIGYVRVSKADGSQDHALQLDAMKAQGIEPANIYEDTLTGSRDDRPGMDACLKALRSGDVLLVWKLDRFGRSTRHLINTVEDLAARGVGFKVLTGHFANVDTSTPDGKFFFHVLAGLAQFERDLLRERTLAGLTAARARGRVGGRKPALTRAQVRTAQAAIGKPETVVSELADELGVTRSTLYRYVSPEGELRELGRQVLGMVSAGTTS